MEKKIALIMGASRGIGRAIAIALVGDYLVLLNYCRSADGARQTLDKIQAAGGVGSLLRGDVASSSQMQTLFQQVETSYGKLDALVNCSGIMHDSPVERLEEADWDRVLDVNLKGIYLCCKFALPLLRKSGSGRIVNISSQAAFTGSGMHAHYAASKAGILGFTYSLAKEVGGNNITVNVVSPGRIDTEMIEERKNGREEEWLNRTPLKRLGAPEEVASAVRWLCSPGASYVTGANININGGLLMG